ncbi:MAG TPA: HNH endonuclease signature motif containing protein, partial [Blastocatellia bacterium]
LRGHRCEVCGITEWMGRAAPLELDHRDGNPFNNHLSNLRLICPNCHSQTHTYKNRNMGRGRFYRRLRYAAGKSH